MSEGEGEAERRARVASELTAVNAQETDSLCVVAARLVGVSGAGVVLVSGGRALGNVCVSDATARAVEDVQYMLGEGPCVDACAARAPVLVPDLANPSLVRWPGFRDAAQSHGVRAAFGFPLLIESVCIGALNLYCDEPGPLASEQMADAAAVADAAGRIVLNWQSVAGPGSLAWQLEQLPEHRAVVHQATGMVAVQAAVSVDDALVLLRAYAFAEDRTISDVAAEVVDRALRFDDPPSDAHS